MSFSRTFFIPPEAVELCAQWVLPTAGYCPVLWALSSSFLQRPLAVSAWLHSAAIAMPVLRSRERCFQITNFYSNLPLHVVGGSFHSMPPLPQDILEVFRLSLIMLSITDLSISTCVCSPNGWWLVCLLLWIETNCSFQPAGTSYTPGLGDTSPAPCVNFSSL